MRKLFFSITLLLLASVNMAYGDECHERCPWRGEKSECHGGIYNGKGTVWCDCVTDYKKREAIRSCWKVVDNQLECLGVIKPGRCPDPS